MHADNNATDSTGGNYTVATTVAHAGADQTVCATSTTLAGNQPFGTSTGHWTVVSGAGTFTNANLFNTTVTALGSGANTFRWTITKPAACGGGTSTDDVVITQTAAPAITSVTADQTVCAGSSASFTVAATGTSLTYQWYKGSGTGTPVTNTGDITGATTATLSFSATVVGDAGTYHVVVSSGTCTPADSQTSPGLRTLTVNSPPAITTGPTPASASISTGGSQNFAITATGAGLTFQWYKGSGTGTPVTNAAGHIAGATTNTLMFTNAVVGDTGSYHVVVTGTCSPTADSSLASLTVTAPNVTSVTKTVSPSNVYPSSPLTYTVTITTTGTNTFTMNDPAPSGFTFGTVTANGGGVCTSSTSTNATCTWTSVAAGTFTVTIPATSSASVGTYTNTATAGSQTGSVDVNVINSCSAAGQDGPGGTLAGVVNTYYPGTASAAAGATTLTLGAPTGDTSKAIAINDLFLVIQMQGVDINMSNNSNYGAGTGTGAGFTALNNTGKYELVHSLSTLAANTAGTINIVGTGAGAGLNFAYTNADATGTAGQRRFQVIRIPQYSSASLGSATARAWSTITTVGATNGLGTGGVLAIDVAGALDVTGTTADVSGKGFRGGGGLQIQGDTGGTLMNTDFRSTAPTAGINPAALNAAGALRAHGSKGEGIAGTPEWVAGGAGNVSILTNQPNDGYPGGSAARGAPANAGGGSTDDHPAANDDNSGGGGGSNGGAGGLGGDSWSTGNTRGGTGAAAPAPTLQIVFMGGGGGAGTRNNSDGINDAASGAAGGGVMLLRAAQITGTGALNANGTDAPNDTLNDGGGGGGAGGSILLITTSTGGSLANVTLNAHGGKGGDTWDIKAETNPPCTIPNRTCAQQAISGGTCDNRHGPGGGGGGGSVLYQSGVTPPTVNVSGGTNGTSTTVQDAYCAVPGSTGVFNTADFTTVPGFPGASDCFSDPAVFKSHTGDFVQGQSGVFTLHITNAAPTSVGAPSLFGITSGTLTVTDTIPTTPVIMTPVSATGTGWGPGTNACTISSQTVTCTRSDSLAPGASYPDITITVTVGSNATGTDTNVATLSVSGGGSNPDSNTGNDSSSDPVLIQSPTPATLERFKATREGDVVRLRWRTSYEVRNLGFEIYRDIDGERTKITPSFIAGSGMLVGMIQLSSGMSYQWMDTHPGAAGQAVYWLRDVDLDGSEKWYGPFGQEEASGSSPGTGPGIRLQSLGNGNSALFSNLNAQSNAILTAPGFGVSLAAKTAPTANTLAQQWILASEAGAKISVNAEGWYRVTRSQLAAAGFDPGPSSSDLQLFVEGQQVPFLINDGGDGSFDPSDSIEFYGTGLDTASTDTRVYWLVLGTSPGLRVPLAGAGGNKPAPANFRFTVQRKDRTVYFANLVTNGDNENFFGAVITSNPTDETLSVTHVDPAASGTSTLEISLQGTTTGVDHQVDVAFNGHDLGTITFADQDDPVTDIPVPTAWVVEGDNHVVMTAQGGSMDFSVVDYIQITYPHLYVSDSDALRFTAPGSAKVTVGGFSSAAVRVFDISNPSSVRQVPATVTPDGGAFDVSVATSNGSATLLAVADDRVSAAAGVASNTPSSLNVKTNQADFILISHPGFAFGVAPLASLRQQQGLQAKVVDITDVYDEFSYGEKSPQAIKDFLSRATSTWKRKPRYVLLNGDASFDERGYFSGIGFPSTDFVPTKLIPTTYLKTASDDWFVDFNNDGLPDLPIGRLPADTPDDVTAMVAKITGYGSGGAWTHHLVIAADLNDDNDFTSLANSLAATVPSTFTVQTFLRNALTPQTEHDDVVAAINAGQLLVNYIGHGSEQTWGKESFFDNTDAVSLSDGSTLPVVIAMDCLNGFFQDVFEDTLAEAFLKMPSTGAVAVWASSALTEPIAQGQVDRALHQRLLKTPSPRIGDAIVSAKSATKDPDVRRTWILFGDPTMYLAH